MTTASKPRECGDCGHVWPRDPALEVPCKDCRAPVGSPCKRPSGHKTWGGEPHKIRDIRAARLGHYHHEPCCFAKGPAHRKHCHHPKVQPVAADAAVQEASS